MLRSNALKIGFVASGLLAGGISALAISPIASATDGPCVSSGSATVCQGQESATPPVPAGGFGGQNGAYGPSGDIPPVGGNGR